MMRIRKSIKKLLRGHLGIALVSELSSWAQNEEPEEAKRKILHAFSSLLGITLHTIISHTSSLSSFHLLVPLSPW